MNILPDFPRILSLLRQEKGVSQRVSAADLSVSQALLSHYENGIREPGLQFVVNAAAYYGVSCDYLLGRSMSRDGSAITVRELHDFSSEKGNVLKGNIYAVLQKKLIANSVALLLELVGQTNDKDFIADVSYYISIAIYKIARSISQSDPKNFALADEAYSAVCDAQMRLCEMQIRCRVAGLEPNGRAVEALELPDMSHDALIKAFPAFAQSFFSLLQSVSEKISEQLAQKKPD